MQTPVFGLPGELVVIIPEKSNFYSLYADGQYSRKTFIKETGQSFFAYQPGSVVFLYYTYPNLRITSAVRNFPGNAGFPGLSKKNFSTFHCSQFKS